MSTDLPRLCGYVRGVCGQQGKRALLLTGIPATVHSPLKWGDRGNSRDTVSGTEMQMVAYWMKKVRSIKAK